MPHITYFHTSKKNLTANDVGRVITQAGYDVSQCAITPLMSDGFQAVSADPMAVSPLQAAAKKLNLDFVISSAASAQLAAESTSFSLSFTMSADTVTALQGSTLVVFKGVKSQGGAAGAMPLAWFASTAFSTTNSISWTEDYSAYVSTQTIVPNGVITASDSHPITFGQVMNVQNGGIGVVGSGGQGNALSINNTTSTPFVCGIGQTPPGASAAQPLCAFNLYGNHEDVFIPEEKLFLMFVGGTVKLGTVVAKSIGAGLLVDLTGVVARNGISYDINNGWAWGGFSWGQQQPPNSALSPLLIDNSSGKLSQQRPRLSLAA